MSVTDEMSKSDTESYPQNEDIDVTMESDSTAGDSSVIQSVIPVYPHRSRDERKRRRVIGNTDNTLDGLVAKRAEVDPLSKRYQTENDAIVLPDEEVEIKRMENDPDVATRVCSVCGYQGKWVSEMIRHKRVHTNDRPFKCKYCSRTSKWKADLVRHVAKTHGIRVVSKYSRSKAFDGNHEINTLPASLESTLVHKAHPIPVIRKAQMTKESAKCFNTFIKEGNSNDATIASFRCLTCFFEQDSLEILINHLHNVHNTFPFECLQCKRNFDDVHGASSHCSIIGATCTPLSIKINFSPIYSNMKSQNTFSWSSATTSSPSSIRSDSETSTSSVGLLGDDLIACSECPFKADSEEKLLFHKQGHGTPKGPFNYKCVFCSFYAKKKSVIEKHMALHTSRPEEFMEQVERNLVTFATLDHKHANSNMINNPPLTSMLADRLQGASPLFNPAISTIQSGPLLNMATNQLLASLLYQSALPPPTNIPDMLTNPQLFPLNLSTLLELYKSNSTNLLKIEQPI